MPETPPVYSKPARKASYAAAIITAGARPFPESASWKCY